MRFASLGSGSQGNGLIIEAQQTRILVDCGFSVRETIRRLARLNIAPEQLTAIVVTHEHGDHSDGVFSLAAQYHLPVWLTHGTLTAMSTNGCPEQVEINLIDVHEKFSIDGVEVKPYPVPHDAREPSQYVFSDGSHNIGILTDTGRSTPHIEAMLNRCHAIFLECNHDRDLLFQSNYPPLLKQRIAGPYGHLDNMTSAKILSAIDSSCLQHIIAAHLSQQNNTPLLASTALAQALNCEPEWIGIAKQESGLCWRELV